MNIMNASMLQSDIYQYYGKECNSRLKSGVGAYLSNASSRQWLANLSLWAWSSIRWNTSTFWYSPSNEKVYRKQEQQLSLTLMVVKVTVQLY